MPAMFDKDRITFYTNGKWKGGGIIPPTLREVGDLSDWIGSFVNYCRQLGKDYTLFSGNDGALVGQEKASLAESLEGLIGGLVIFRQYLTDSKPASFESLEKDRHDYFSMRVEFNSWTGYGHGKPDEELERSGFAQWYNDVLLKRLGEALRAYARAQSDGSVTEPERFGIISLVERIIADMLAIDRVLVTGNLTR